jgi:hypothetical protein
VRLAITTSTGAAVEAWHLLVVLAVAVLLVTLTVGVPGLGGRVGRAAGYMVGVLIYLVISQLLSSLPGDDRDWPWRLVVAVLAVAVAVDLLLQVPRVRPAPKQVAIAVAGWGVGAVLLTPIVVAIYVTRRVMNLPVIRQVPVTR